MKLVRTLDKEKFLMKAGYNYLKHLSFIFTRLLLGGMIFRGKKVRAFNNILLVKRLLKQSFVGDPTYKLFFAFNNAVTYIRLKKVKSGGATLVLPLPFREIKQLNFAVRMFLSVLKGKKVAITAKNVVTELNLLFDKRGDVAAKTALIHRLAKENKFLLTQYFK